MKAVLIREPHDAGVRPEKADVFSGGQSHRGKSQEPRSWTAGRRETETLKPVDKPICGMASESPGRTARERRGGPDSEKPRRPSPQPEGEGRMARRRRARATGHSGGVGATAR
jgi:hypothetical protein